MSVWPGGLRCRPPFCNAAVRPPRPSQTCGRTPRFSLRHRKSRCLSLALGTHEVRLDPLGEQGLRFFAPSRIDKIANFTPSWGSECPASRCRCASPGAGSRECRWCPGRFPKNDGGPPTWARAPNVTSSHRAWKMSSCPRRRSLLADVTLRARVGSRRARRPS